MSSDDNNGLFWVLGCLIILTMTGVFLSLVIDKKLHSSKASNGFRQKIELDARKIQSMKSELSTALERVESIETAARETEAIEYQLRNVLKEHRESIAEKISDKEQLITSIPQLETEFANYQKEYRRITWRDAVGEKIDHLFLKNGRQFDSVVIKRVTPFGFEISHSHGLARIDYNDLGLKYRDKFQWNEEEKQGVLRAERRNRRPQTSTPSIDRKLPESIQSADEEKAVEVANLQDQFRLYRSRVSALRRSHTEAFSNSRYGTSKSVPGSLRTWSEQAQIIDGQLNAATEKLSIITGQLRQLAPDDPLLKSN